MAAVASSETLLKNVDKAAKSALRSRGAGNRGIGEEVEHRLAPLLTNDVQDEIAAEAIAELPTRVPSFGKVRSIAWEWAGEGRPLADFFVTVTGTQRTSVIPVNLKTEQLVNQCIRWQTTCSTNAVVKVALGLPLMGKKTFKAEEVALRLLAGDLRVHSTATDYFVLSAMLKGNRIESVRSQGLLSGVAEFDDSIRFAWRRNSVRPDSVEFTHTDLVLPADFDVNTNLALTLLPRIERPFLLEALAVSAAAKHGAPLSDLQAMARQMLEDAAK